MCILIIPVRQDIFKLVDFINSLITFHLIDTYIYVNEYVYSLITNYDDIFNEND